MTAARAALAGLVAACLIAAAPAAADRGGSLTRGGMSEKQLRAFETRVLGPEHAAEHARMRAAIRSGRMRTASPGRVAEAPPVADPATEGQWTAHFPIPVIAINAVMLPTGKVLWFAYPKNPKGNPDAANLAQAYLWDPAKGHGADAFERVDPPGQTNIWCAGNAFTADGRVVVAGGNLAYATATSNYKGLNKLYTFNPWSEQWTEQPDMAHGRWYPSEVLMPDERMLIMSGFDENGDSNRDIEVFTPSPELDGRGTVTKLGTRSSDGADAPPDGDLYPHLFWMPSGRVFVAGPELADSWFLHSPIGQDPFVLDRQSWDDIPSASRHVWGSAVLVPEGPNGSRTVEQIGGTDPERDANGRVKNGLPKSTTELYDESGPATAPWTAGAPMQVPRSHLNTVQLPDGSMVSVGGGIGSVNGDQYAVSPSGEERRVDLFNPATNSWHLGAAQAEARAYHSTALLLPDATVVSAGDDFNGTPTASDPTGAGAGLDSDTAEVYEPPYLFNSDGSHASRPAIATAPTAIRWGDSFHVGSPDNVASAALVAPGATTHANDMNQRVIPLALEKDACGVRVTAPPDPNIALPGYYMLFVLNDRGVPSVARWVRLSWSSPSPDEPCPPPPANPTGGSAPGGSGKAFGTGTGGGDSTGPVISFTRSGFSARRGRLRGRVSDASGVKSVQVALARQAKGCRWWSRRLGRLARARSCRRPAWIRARLTRKGSGALWAVSLRGRIPRGTYLVSLSAVDGRGNVTSRVAHRSVKAR